MNSFSKAPMNEWGFSNNKNNSTQKPWMKNELSKNSFGSLISLFCNNFNIKILKSFGLNVKWIDCKINDIKNKYDA